MKVAEEQLSECFRRAVVAERLPYVAGVGHDASNGRKMSVFAFAHSASDDRICRLALIWRYVMLADEDSVIVPFVAHLRSTVRDRHVSCSCLPREEITARMVCVCTCSVICPECVCTRGEPCCVSRSDGIVSSTCYTHNIRHLNVDIVLVCATEIPDRKFYETVSCPGKNKC